MDLRYSIGGDSVHTVNFVRHLDNHLRFIETSAREYDLGQIIEAIRIATSLRVIFHQTSSSTSILTHLNCNGIKLSSTLHQPPYPSGTWTPLVYVQQKIHYADGKVTGVDPPEYKPKLYSIIQGGLIPAPDWWDCEPAFFLNNKKVSRKDIVLWAANKDGGSHVDSSLPFDYVALQNQNNDLMVMKIGFPYGSETSSRSRGVVAEIKQLL